MNKFILLLRDELRRCIIFYVIEGKLVERGVDDLWLVFTETVLNR